MKKNRTAWIALTALVVILAGASILYSRLKDSVGTEQLIVGMSGEKEAGTAGSGTDANTANPEEGEAAGKSVNPEEGEAAGKSANPEEGEAAGKSANPEEGETAVNAANPEEGEAAGKSVNPEEGEAAGKSSEPEEGETATEARKESETGTDAEEEKTMAPDFSAVDQDGETVRLSDFLGKPVILNFWASWCGPCKSEMPDFEEKYAEYGDDIHFLIVNMTDGSRETVDLASAYVEEQGFTFPVYFDTNYEASIAYHVTSIPATYFIDEEGALVARGAGALDADTLQRGIDMLIR